MGGAVVFLGATLAFLLLAVFPPARPGAGRMFIDRLVPARARPAARGYLDRFLVGLARSAFPGWTS